MSDEITNILKVFLNLKKFGTNNLSKVYVIPKNKPSITNRANHMGEALEFFMKDALCGTLIESNAQKKRDEYSKNFCYLGNQNNPPDIMIKEGGDAIEVKKINGTRFNDLALNSSYPKAKIYSNSPMITNACATCETWTERDIIYAVGQVENNKLKFLALVYGDCYCADAEIYENVKKKITEGINKTGLEFSKTKELGRVNKVDPLGITNLRIRGMWTIKNPLSVFTEYFGNSGKEMNIYLVLKKEKYNTLNKKDKELIEKDKDFKIKDIKIPNPSNPAKQLNAIAISYEK